MVADALNRKTTSLNAMMESLPPELQQEITQLNLVIVNAGLANILEVTPTLEDEIRMAKLMTKFYKVISDICKKARLRISPRTRKVHSGIQDGMCTGASRLEKEDFGKST